jgi:hypothetical protein
MQNDRGYNFCATLIPTSRHLARIGSETIEKLMQINVESISDLLQRPDPDLLVAILQLRHVLARQIGVIRKHGLGPPAFGSQGADAPPDLNTDVLCHAFSMAVY